MADEIQFEHVSVPKPFQTVGCLVWTMPIGASGPQSTAGLARSLMGPGKQANGHWMGVALGYREDEISRPRAAPQGLKLVTMKREQLHCRCVRRLGLGPRGRGQASGPPCTAQRELQRNRYLLLVFMHIYPAAQCQNKGQLKRCGTESWHFS